jgi:hypothetical protein
MNKAYGESGTQFQGNIADQIYVQLHYSSAPYAIASESYPVNLNIDGTSSLILPSSFNATYYIAIRHRNSIETWSSSPISFSATTINYNFSDAANKAFGNNLKEFSGKYLIFTGDVNQDGIVDSGDMIPMDNDAATFVIGYVLTDINGDGLVDSGDMIAVDNNATSFVTKASPE